MKTASTYIIVRIQSHFGIVKKERTDESAKTNLRRRANHLYDEKDEVG
jgi:hypothetical protein